MTFRRGQLLVILSLVTGRLAESISKMFIEAAKPVDRLDTQASVDAKDLSLSRLYKPETLYESFSCCTQPAEVRSYIPQLSLSERSLIEDVLLMILGLETPTFAYVAEEGFSIKAVLSVSHLTPLTLENILLLFVQFANKIKYIENKLDLLSLRQSVVMSNLIFAIRNYVKQLKDFYAGILAILEYQSGRVDRSHVLHRVSTLNVDESMTFLKLKAIVEKDNNTVAVILGVIKRCLISEYSKDNNTSGVLLLNILWELLEKLEHEPINSSKAKVILTIFSSPLIKYLDFIKEWLQGKELNDPFNQFYIISASPGDSANTSFLENVVLRKAKNVMIPAFLKGQAEQIYLNGRFIKILYCFAKEIDQRRISEDLNVDGEFHRLKATIEKFSSNNSEEVPMRKQKRFKAPSITKRLGILQQPIMIQKPQISQDLPYDMGVSYAGAFDWCRTQEVEQLKMKQEHVESNHQVESRFFSEFAIIFELELGKTLENIKTKCEKYFCFSGSPLNQFSTIRQKVDLHMEAIKRFMLAGQGDFIQELIESISDELDKSVGLISANSIKSSIEHASKNSSAKDLPEDIIKSLSWRFIINQNAYFGWDVFSLDCKLEYPLVLVFPQSIMDRYSLIFNFLWKLKRIESIVKKLWVDNYCLAKKGKIRIPMKYFGFRHAVNHFATSIWSQILVKIQIEWDKFMERKQKINNFYEFLSEHHNFVNVLEQITFISLRDKTISSKIAAVSQVVLRFKNLNLYVESEDYDFLVSKQKYLEMLRLQNEFDTLVKQLIVVHSSLAKQIIDFNSFYDAL